MNQRSWAFTTTTYHWVTLLAYGEVANAWFYYN